MAVDCAADRTASWTSFDAVACSIFIGTSIPTASRHYLSGREWGKRSGQRTGRYSRSGYTPTGTPAAARLFPQTKLFEDLAQQGTEGQITQRFENVSPLANLGPALRGETVKPT